MHPFVIYFVFVIHLNLDSKDPQGAGAGCKGQRWNVIVTPQNGDNRDNMCLSGQKVFQWHRIVLFFYSFYPLKIAQP